MVRIGEEVSETLEWRPASFVRLQIVRPKFAKQGEPEAGVVIADVADSPIPRSLAGPGLLAHVLVSKYGDHLPLHRQEKIFERQGVHLARSTLCGWVGSCAEVLGYLVEAMAKDALSAHCIAIDATGVLVQAKDKCRRGHFWVLVADRDHVLFRFTPRHNQDGPKTFLRGYKGYVQADASSVYEELFRTEQVTEVGCWAHGRRRFFEAMSSDKERAMTALGFIHQLFAIDKATKELPPSRRTEQRRSRAQPVLDAFRAWLDREELLVLPRSPIAGAIGYARNQWTALTRFLEDGRLRLDNNRSELELRREALGRKNWIFVGSDDGAEWNATIVSLIASCALHQLDPWAYLRDVLILLPSWPRERVIELAPKSWKQTLEHTDARQRLAASPWTWAPATLAA
ncbi:IS66 family transposase [Sorangium sp. So ce260]